MNIIERIKRVFSMIKLKSEKEVEIMRESALLVSKTLAMIAQEIGPGKTTLQLDKMAYDFIMDHGAKPGFLGLYDYKYTLCTSVNEEVVHGIPNDNPLKEGDIVSIDCGVLMNGFYGDHAYTFQIGEVSEEVKRLLKVTKESLYLGIKQAKSLNRIGDISYAIQEHAEKHGYGVVRELVGHGLGRKLHEDPPVPNYGKKRRGPLMRSGLVLAIEPMINMGSREVAQLDDGWTIITKDGKPSAHFEHNIAIVNGTPSILSDYNLIETELDKRNYPYV